MTDKYGQPREEREEELDADGVPILRPTDRVIVVEPGGGTSEAPTSDRERMKERIEKASKVPIEKKPEA